MPVGKYAFGKCTLQERWQNHQDLQLIKRQSCNHMETSQLICWTNQLTWFYMIATLPNIHLHLEY